jgi:hypothetical protein
MQPLSSQHAHLYTDPRFLPRPMPDAEKSIEFKNSVATPMHPLSSQYAHLYTDAHFLPRPSCRMLKNTKMPIIPTLMSKRRKIISRRHQY